VAGQAAARSLSLAYYRYALQSSYNIQMVSTIFLKSTFTPTLRTRHIPWLPTKRRDITNLLCVRGELKALGLASNGNILEARSKYCTESFKSALTCTLFGYWIWDPCTAEGGAACLTETLRVISLRNPRVTNLVASGWNYTPKYAALSYVLGEPDDQHKHQMQRMRHTNHKKLSRCVTQAISDSRTTQNMGG
jgi:hypothetical protein